MNTGIVRPIVMSAFLLSTLWGPRSSEAATATPDPALMNAIAKDALAAGQAPGLSFVVVRDGQVVYAQGFGNADIAHAQPVEADTRFAIGSLTKQFTAAAILLLAQRGKLALDDPLANYLPTFPNASAITLRMLLNQTSGLHNYPTPGEHPWPFSGLVTVDEIVAILATDKPDFAPGTRWAYSNANYALLSAVIAKASGADEATFLQANIFAPLHMTSTGFGNAAQGGTAMPYSGAAPFQPQIHIGLGLFSGAGAMVSNALDLARWDTALINGTLLDKTSMQALWSAGTLADGSSANYAMGFFPTTLYGHREVWHDGLAPGAGGYGYNAIFPDDKLAVIVLSNGYAFQSQPAQMVNRVLAAYDPHVATALAAAAAVPTSAPGEDPAVTARAKDWLHRLATGTVDMTQVTPSFAAILTPSLLAQIHAGLAASVVTDWVYLGSQTVGDVTYATYWIRVDGTPHRWIVGITVDGKIAGSRLQ